MKRLQKQILSSLALTLLVATYAHTAGIPGQGTWETTLLGRDLDGNAATYEAYYDAVQNITWLADANYAKTSSHDADGLMTWSAAQNWASGLDIAGVTGWRLPNTDPINGNSYDYSFSRNGSTDVSYHISAPGTVYAGSTSSELAHLYYNTLAVEGWYDINGVDLGCGITDSCLSNTGPFSNLQSYIYWSGTESSLGDDYAWVLHANNGIQTYDNKTSLFFAWAVRDGDVSAVPIPAAVWLFGSGLIGLIGWSKRKQH